MPPMPPSLFDTPDTWRDSPVEAFSAWLVSAEFSVNRRGEPQALRDSTARVYLAMFRAFAEQVLLDEDGAVKRPLTEIDTEDIQAFLDGRDLQGSIRQRYVRLLERVFDRLASQGLVTSNPARGLAMKQPRTSTQGDDQTVWLTPDQSQAVMRALAPADGESWKARRNKVMQALVLGGGLKVSELVGLRISQVGTARQADGSIFIDVRPSGAGMWHRTRVTPFAAGLVLSWLELRKALSIPGDLLFPASPAGGVLSAATVYRHTAAVMATAGISTEQVKRRGTRTLRNSYAMDQLSAGNPPDLVGHHLGHRSDRGTRYYTELLAKTRSSEPR